MMGRFVLAGAVFMAIGVLTKLSYTPPTLEDIQFGQFFSVGIMFWALGFAIAEIKKPEKKK